jgi:hypothetical protein
MGGQGSHPLGWATVALIVVAYAHVIFEVAAAVLLLVIAARALCSPTPELLAREVRRRVHRHRRRGEIERYVARHEAADGDTEKQRLKTGA